LFSSVVGVVVVVAVVLFFPLVAGSQFLAKEVVDCTTTALVVVGFEVDVPAAITAKDSRLSVGVRALLNTSIHDVVFLFHTLAEIFEASRLQGIHIHDAHAIARKKESRSRIVDMSVNVLVGGDGNSLALLDNLAHDLLYPEKEVMSTCFLRKIAIFFTFFSVMISIGYKTCVFAQNCQIWTPFFSSGVRNSMANLASWTVKNTFSRCRECGLPCTICPFFTKA